MVHLQQENKKLKTEIEEKKLKSGHQRLCAKALNPCKAEPTQRRGCGRLDWRGTAQSLSHRMDVTTFAGTPLCSGMLPIRLLLLTAMLSWSHGQKDSSLILFFKRLLDCELKGKRKQVRTRGHCFPVCRQGLFSLRVFAGTECSCLRSVPSPDQLELWGLSRIGICHL